ncbi:Phosphoinositide phosphatase sac1, partial [Spiromyces aspiralis]
VFYQTKVNVQRVGPDGKHVDACFTIGRTTGEIYTNNEVERKLPQRVVDAVGILGMIKLQSGQHLIIITKQSQVGVIRGQPVYKVDETQILPLSTHRQALTKETDQVEEKYQGLIKQALSIKSYFYSPGYDLTSSIQRQQHHHQQQQQQQLWERADDRFFFNRYVSEPLIQASKEHPQA